MELFGARSKFVGQPVSINEGNQTVEQRYARAKRRVNSLSRKLEKLKTRPTTSDVLTCIDQTYHALEEWKKRLKVAEYEMSLYSNSTEEGNE